MAAVPGAPQRRPHLTQALVTVPLAIVLAVGGTVGWRWYGWATAGESPYDEIGIEVNSRMPDPLRRWACGRIADRFPRAIPPYSCERPR